MRLCYFTLKIIFSITINKFKMEVDQDTAVITGYNISCTNVPPELLLKNVAKQHFRQFGRIVRLIIRPKSRVIIVEYNSETSVQRAILQGAEFNGKTFTIARESKMVVKKKRTKKEIDPDWVPDPEVQAELDAMNNFSSKKRYSLRPEAMAVDTFSPNIKTRKKSIKAKSPDKSVKVTMKASSGLKVSERDELMNILKQPAMTAEERYRVLEARDKLIRSQSKRLIDISKASRTVGTCPDMCPEKERLMREAQHQVALYEQEVGGRSMDPKLAVKQYSRSSADQEFPLPHELRPVSVLQLTMCYLMHRIMNMGDTSDVNVGEWYHFLWDRTRGIRKDITQQELCCQGSVQLVEQCARFHIHCSARLVAEDPSVFDHKINTENLTKCLQTLKYMYHDLSIKGVSCTNEAEFRAYIILLNLNDGNFMWELQQLKPHIQKSLQVRFALQVYSAIDKNNYIKFFKLVNTTTYLNACILLRYFTQVRISALKTILKCYSPRAPSSQYPLTELTNILAFEDVESTVDFLLYFNLSINAERTHLLLDRKTLHLPEIAYTLDRATKIIESKRACSVGEIVCGRALPPPYFESHIPQNSFNINGLINLTDLVDDTEYDENIESRVTELPTKQDLNDSMEMEDSRNTNILEVPVVESIKDEKRSNSPLINIDVTDGGPKIEQPFWIPKQNPPQIQQQSIPINFFAPKSTVITQSIFSGSNLPQKNASIFEQAKAKLPDDLPVIVKKTNTNTGFIKTASSSQVKSLFAKPQETITTSETALTPNIVATQETKQIKINVPTEMIPVKPDETLQRMELIKNQREMEKKKEEQRKLEMIKKKAQSIFVQEVDLLISTIAKEILLEIENDRRNRTLAKIAANIKTYKHKLMIKKWREKVALIHRKRKAVEFSPCYLSTRTLRQEANELYTTSQEETLMHRKRYKNGKAIDLILQQENVIQKIDLFDLTYHNLIKKFAEFDQLQKDIYWKVSISLPDLSEVPYSPNRIEETLNDFLQWKKQNGSVNFIEQVRLSGLQQITYCIEKQQSQKVYSNGLIFIGYDFNASFTNRILDCIKSFKHPLPIAVILQNSVDESKLNVLKHNLISNYTILTNCFTTKHLINLVEDGFIFLAQNAQPLPPLELDTLQSFLQKHLCSELWKRILSYSKWNSDYKFCLKSPDIVVSLYNTALSLLKDMVFNKNNLVYPDFPPVFHEFMKSKIPDHLPCDYKYFPVFWKEKRYQKLLSDLMDSFEVPQFDEQWPPENSTKLEKSIMRYCTKVFEQPSVSFYKIMAVILNSVDLQSDFSNINKLLWTDVIETIAYCKMNEMDFSINDSFVTKSIFNQYFVIYNHKDIGQYSASTWFYVNNPMIKKQMKLASYEPKIVKATSVPVVHNDFHLDFDLDKTLNDLLADNMKSDEKLRKRKAEFEEVESMLQSLEDTMKIQKIINRKFDDTFDRVLNDT